MVATTLRKLLRRFVPIALSLLMAGPAAADIELFGGNPLLDAITANDDAQVARLLRRGDSPEVADFEGRSAIIYAAVSGNVDIIDLLIKKRVDVNHRDSLGNTALFYAASQQRIDAMQVLIEAGADKNAENRQGMTPLMSAASLGHVEAMLTLLDAGADATRHDYTGRTALMWAEWNRHRDVVRLLKAKGIRE
jgi:ankyrin repeat protein